MTAPLLRLRGVERTYGVGGVIRALNGIELDVDEGDYLAITGRSGSGKSTLLNVLGLLERPTAGVYEVDGVSTQHLKPSRLDTLRAHMFGLVFQEFHLVDYLSVQENIQLGLTYSSGGRTRDAARVRAVVEQVGIEHRLSARTNTLSGGERQRVAIARTLARHPRVLLADEPTGNLDEANADAILRLFDDIHTSGITVVVVTHDPETAARAAHHVLIRDGVAEQQR